MDAAEGPEQLALPGSGRSPARASRAPRRRPVKPERRPAAEGPVARVAVDVSLAHLDRFFDFLVDDRLAEAAQPGVRVRVRFSGRLVDGYVVERADSTEHTGRLAFLDRVVSAEPVLAPEILRLARAVADRYAGTLADVLRLAVPARHARSETAPTTADGAPPAADAGRGAPVVEWTAYDGGPAFLDGLASGRVPRAVWTALPGGRWPVEVAGAVAGADAAGRGALVVVPDLRDVARVDRALTDVLGPARHTVLTADLGPAERYRRWLAVRRGACSVVLGTRAAMFAPVHNPGLFVVWDDGDDLHAEPRAPYPHVREVLALRSAQEDAGLLVGGFSRTAEGAALLAAGWARPLAASRARVRAAAPLVRAAGDDSDLAADPAARAARLPTVAWRAAHDALARGPVLVQVPRAGYLPGLACTECRASARCPACHGPLVSTDHSQPPACRWCGRPARSWSCPHCDGRALRATAVGARRTAEELGRAFPGTAVRTSAGDAVLPGVPGDRALVVATPGAEPVAQGGYAAALLLDGWALLARPDLRVAEETLRRWLGAASLVRPASEGGTVVVVAEAATAAVQALVRWDPAGFADRELAEREALQLPPAAAVATMTGEPAALRQFAAVLALPNGAEVLGPVPALRTRDGGDQQRLVIRAGRQRRRELAAALHAASAARSAHKDAGQVRVQVDPTEFG